MIDNLKDLIKRYISKNTFLWKCLKKLEIFRQNLHAFLNKSRWKYNENQVKIFMEEYAKKTKDFFFVEIGANDGIKADPSREYILKYKWKGILIEPQREIFAKLKLNYKNKGLLFENVAITDKNGTMSMYKLKKDLIKERWHDAIATLHLDRSMLSNLDKDKVEIEHVKCMTFAKLLKKYNIHKIDLLQIDTEGYDYEILKTVSFDKIKPKIVRFEYVHMKNYEKKELQKHLKNIGYTLMEEKSDIVAIHQRK